MALIGVNPTAVAFATATNTTPVLGGGKGFSVGQLHFDESSGKVYVFAQVASAITQYDVVYIDPSTGIATGLATSASAAAQQVGVAAATLASGQYGWVQVYGRTSVSVLGAAAKSKPLYSTTTAGALDDATASNYRINGIVLATTNPSSTATAMDGFICWPNVTIRPGAA